MLKVSKCTYSIQLLQLRDSSLRDSPGESTEISELIVEVRSRGQERLGMLEVFLRGLGLHLDDVFAWDEGSISGDQERSRKHRWQQCQKEGGGIHGAKYVEEKQSRGTMDKVVESWNLDAGVGVCQELKIRILDSGKPRLLYTRSQGPLPPP